MNRALVVPIVLFLVACSGEPKLKADTEANFNDSFAEVAKRLSAEDKKTLDAALKDIVLVQVRLYGPVVEAESYQLPSNDPGAELTRTFTKTFTGAASRMVYVAAAAKWDENRAKAIVGNARAIVDGRTAKEIIEIADDERKKALEIAIATYRDQLAKAKSALTDIQAETENAAQRQTELKETMEKIVLTKPKFFYRKDEFIEKPIISFNIANKGTVPVKRIFVNGTLQTPGRAVPWIVNSFNYEIDGGLEPNETQNLSLAPNMFSDWGKVPQKAVDGAVLTLKLTAFEDATGKRLGQDSGDDDRLAARKNALEGAVRDLEGKIADFEKQDAIASHHVNLQ